MVTQKACLKTEKKQVHNMIAKNHPENSQLEEPNSHYHELRKWRNEHIQDVLDDPNALNEFHDQLMKTAVQTAIKKVESELGPAPAHFAFFLMGSGGRSEQSVWSDQDHGIIFSGDEANKAYFLKIGEEIAVGLDIVGYDACDGWVMASNKKWCNSIEVWEQQITDWLEEASFDSMRYFSTFFDSRVLIGDPSYLRRLKEHAFIYLKESPHLLNRFVDNISHLKKGLGILGQFLPDTFGKESGNINMKEVIFFPYVNSMRVLALKEQILATPTLARFQQLPNRYSQIKQYESDFKRLLDLRLHLKKDAACYDEVHFLNIGSLTKSEKKELKQIMKHGYKLFAEAKEIIKKGCSP